MTDKNKNNSNNDSNNNGKIKVDLSTPMKDGTDNYIIKMSRKTLMMDSAGLGTITLKELNNHKKFLFGDALCDMLSRKIKPKNTEDAARIKRWHAKIYNETTKSNSSILLDSDELKEIKEIMSTANPEFLDVIVDGTLFDVISDYLELAINAKK